jgi:hypothetical protein
MERIYRRVFRYEHVTRDADYAKNVTICPLTLTKEVDSPILLGSLIVLFLLGSKR